MQDRGSAEARERQSKSKAYK